MAKILGLQAKFAPRKPFDASLDAFLTSDRSLVDTQNEAAGKVEDKWASTQGSEEVAEQLGLLWTSILVRAATTSVKDQKLQKLVQFVKSLTERPDMKKGDAVCQVQDMTVWRDLPAFGYSVRDCWNFDGSDQSSPEEKSHWVNVNAFIASLAASDANDHLGLALFGMWTIRTGLEESQQMISEINVAAAAVWFAFAAPQLKKLSVEGKTYDGKMAKPGSAFEDREWRGYSTERWETWVKKLDEIAGQLTDDSARELVGQAQKAMSETS